MARIPRFSSEIVQKITDDKLNGLSYKEISEKYDCKISAVFWYLKRRAKIENKNPKIIIKKILSRKLNEGKSYKDYLAVENEKRKKNGLYKFKTKILH